MRASKILLCLRAILKPPLGLPEAKQKSHIKSEIRSLSYFVASPFFNTNQKVVELFEYLIRFAPTFEGEELEPEAVFKAIFPNEPFEEGKVRRLRSKLFTVIKEYIYIQSLKKDTFLPKLSLLRFFGEHKMVDDFNKQTKIFFDFSDLKDQPIPKDYFYQDYLLQKEINKMESGFLDDGLSGLHFQETADALDRFFMYQKLVYSCQMLNREKELDLKAPFDMGIHPFTDGEIRFREEKTVDVVLQIWIEAYRLLQSTNEQIQEHFDRLEELLDEHFTILAPNDLSTLHTFLLNSIKYFTTDAEVGLRKRLQLFKKQIDKEVFLNTFTISQQHFVNMVTVYLKLKDVEGAEQFLSDYKAIFPVSGDDTYKLCLGLVLFEKQLFASLIDLAENEGMPIRFNNIYHRVKWRRLLIKTYFELNELDDFVDELEGAVNKLRVFLHRYKEEMLERFYDANRQFNNIVERIYKVAPGDSKSLRSILNQLEEGAIVFEKNWLLAKINERLHD